MMDICTITEFREALLDSHHTLTPLGRVEADIESIHRSTYFAECRARLNGEAILCDTAPYTARSISESHPPLVEGLRRISTPDGVGFEDEHHNVVIAPRWQWADDFREGRAAVMNHDGLMGLINRHGEEVIPVIYNDIQYSATTGESWVSNGHGWALFDYCGVQITDWQELNTADIIR